MDIMIITAWLAMAGAVSALVFLEPLPKLFILNCSYYTVSILHCVHT